MKTILFVCTQNVFRSFSAEKLFLKYLEEKGDAKSFKVISAGTQAYPDRPYSYTLNKLDELGITDLHHTQTRLTQEMVDEADYIICMTNDHKWYVKEVFGADAILINEIVYGQSTDLEDDDENTSYTSLKDFVEMTVEKINYAIPFIYEFVTKA